MPIINITVNVFLLADPWKNNKVIVWICRLWNSVYALIELLFVKLKYSTKCHITAWMNLQDWMEAAPSENIQQQNSIYITNKSKTHFSSYATKMFAQLKIHLVILLCVSLLSPLVSILLLTKCSYLLGHVIELEGWLK